MIGPEDFHDSLLELSTLLLGEETTHSLLQRIVDMTCAAVPGCSHVGMSHWQTATARPRPPPRTARPCNSTALSTATAKDPACKRHARDKSSASKT